MNLLAHIPFTILGGTAFMARWIAVAVLGLSAIGTQAAELVPTKLYLLAGLALGAAVP